MTGDPVPQRVAEARFLALTVVAAAVTADPEAARLGAEMVRGADSHAIIGALVTLLAEVLREHGADVGAWAAERQAEEVARMGD